MTSPRAGRYIRSIASDSRPTGRQAMNTASPSPAHVFESFAAMPPRQLALVIAFFVVGAVTVNGVFALHYRRVGKPVLKSLFNPMSFPILDFDRREWLLLAASFILSMAIGIAAALSG